MLRSANPYNLVLMLRSWKRNMGFSFWFRSVGDWMDTGPIIYPLSRVSHGQEQKPKRASISAEGLLAVQEWSIPSEHLLEALKPDFQDRKVIRQGFRAA